jgi:hypothetical protein
MDTVMSYAEAMQVLNGLAGIVSAAVLWYAIIGASN